MAKNPVFSSREAVNKPSKKGDSFFMRPKKKFEFKGRDRKPNFKKVFKPTGESFKPSQSGGSDFFVNPRYNKVSDEIAQKKIQDSPIESIKGESKPKKPFDKKKYRLQKYSNKYKLQQWEEKRKTAVLRGYYKNLKDDEPKLNVKSIYEQYKDDIDSENDDTDAKIKEENENNLNVSISEENAKSESLGETEEVPKNSKQKKGRAFKKAHQEFQRIKEEKNKKKEELQIKKAEREEALQAYKKKKTEKFKKLSRKTKRGQPIMKDRIEMLLERIQTSIN